MTTVRAKSVACGVAILGALGLASSLQAQTGIGTWVRQSEASTPGVITMTIEACCNGGRRVIYHMVGTETVMTIASPFDGSDAPVLVGDKPSGETMGIKWVDDHHTITVVKMNGKTESGFAKLMALSSRLLEELDSANLAAGRARSGGCCHCAA